MPWLRHLAVFFAFLAAFARPAPASAFTPASPETRIGAFEVAAQLLAGELGAASLEQHQGIGAAYDENASGYRSAAGGGGGRLVDVYRAVQPAELADIQATGGFRTLAGGVEGKYFTTSGEAAASYARQAVRAFNDPPYTIVRTQVPESVLLRPGISATVDRGIPAYVLSDEVLPGLRPEILNYSPAP